MVPKKKMLASISVLLVPLLLGAAITNAIPAPEPITKEFSVAPNSSKVIVTVRWNKDKKCDMSLTPV